MTLLTIESLCAEAALFSAIESIHPQPTLYGVTDGKAIGTYLEQKFRQFKFNCITRERMKLQTVKYDSLFTHLDFRSKLVVMLSVTILAFLWESPIAGGILMLSVIVSCVLAGVRLNYLGNILKVMIPFYIFLILSMGFFNVEQVKLLTSKSELTPLLSLPQTWWLIGGAKMSLEGMLYGLNIVFKTLTMILVIPLAIFTTDVNQMTVGMVRAKIPYKVVFIFSSTLRFVPLLLEEVQSIIESQRYVV